MGLVDGEQALVTGAGSGIGRATALRLAQEGAAVAVCDVAETRAETVAEEVRQLGVTSVAIVADVRDDAAVRAMVDQAAESLGGLSVLVNNAGTSTLSPIGELIEEEFDLVVDVCLKGVYAGIRYAVPYLRGSAGGGRIVNTASISGIVPSAGEAHYAAAKAGVIALTKSVAIELAPDIRVNAVAPGTIRTSLTEPQLAIDTERERILALTPAGRVGEPDDVADVILFLCSPLARFVTGVTITVDGGLSLRGSGVGGTLETVSELGVFGSSARARADVTQPGLAFASEAWLDDVAARANSDTAFRETAADADVALAFTAETGEGERAFGMGVRAGELVDVRVGPGAGDVALRAPLEVWRRILEGELDPAKAFTMRTLALDGDMDRLTDAIPALLRLFEILQEQPPSFSDPS